MLDLSAFSQIAKPVAPPNPLDEYGKVLSLADTASQIQQRQAAAQKDQLAQKKLEDAQRVLSDPANFDSATGRVSKEAITKLMGVHPEIAQGLMKTYADMDEKQATNDVAKQNASTSATQAATAAAKETEDERHNQALENAPTPEEKNYQAFLKSEGLQDNAASRVTYKMQGRSVTPNETVIGGGGIPNFTAPPAPPQPEAARSPERMKQDQTLKQMEIDAESAKAAKLAGKIDPRLVDVPLNQHKDVLDKVQKIEDTHTAAETASDRINTALNLARSGNKEAQASASLIGVQALNELANVKRVNSAEIGAYGNAGSLIDSITGKIGKITEGKPIPDDVLNDMQALHTALSANSDPAYVRSLQSIDRTFNSKFVGSPQATSATSGGKPQTMILNGKTLTLGADGLYH